MDAKLARLLTSFGIVVTLGVVTVALVYKGHDYSLTLTALLLALQNFGLQLAGEKSATKEDVKQEGQRVEQAAVVAAKEVKDELERSVKTESLNAPPKTGGR